MPIVLLAYASLYYGGLYQERWAAAAGVAALLIFVSVITVTTLYGKSTKHLYALVFVFYVVAALWTMAFSPRPVVDTFDIFRDTTRMLLNGQNPYTGTYARTYARIDNHYFYLPFGFLFVFPFDLFLGDPRMALLFANIVSGILVYKLFRSEENDRVMPLYVAAFLFLPRSFYMLEHMYLDQAIFMFLLLFLYLARRRERLAAVALSLFFSFKQHLVMLAPILLADRSVRAFLRRNALYFLAPFLLVAAFIAIDAKAFFYYTVVAMLNPVASPSTPTSTPTAISLNVQTFLKMFPFLSPRLIPYLCIILFLFLCGFVLTRKISWLDKATSTLFLFSYFMYLSFYNHYYFIGLFLFLEFMVEEFGLKKAGLAPERKGSGERSGEQIG